MVPTFEVTAAITVANTCSTKSDEILNHMEFALIPYIGVCGICSYGTHSNSQAGGIGRLDARLTMAIPVPNLVV
jgi:hypothetical protein